jgi:hypothetical protein
MILKKSKKHIKFTYIQNYVIFIRKVKTLFSYNFFVKNSQII